MGSLGSVFDDSQSPAIKALPRVIQERDSETFFSDLDVLWKQQRLIPAGV